MAFQIKDAVKPTENAYGAGCPGKVIAVRQRLTDGATIYQVQFRNRNLNRVWLTAEKLEKI